MFCKRSSDKRQEVHRTGAIAYTAFMYGHIQGVGVTAYRVYNDVHIEAEEVAKCYE